MPKATRVDDRRTKAGRRHTNGYGFRPESWKDLGRAAYTRQLEPKEKTAPKDGLSKTDNPNARKDRQAAA